MGVARYWRPVAGTGTGNWKTGSNWADSVNDRAGENASEPTSDDLAIFDEYSFTGPGQIVTIPFSLSNPTSYCYCYELFWDGVLYNPELHFEGSATQGYNYLIVSDDVHFVSGMSVTGIGGLIICCTEPIGSWSNFYTGNLDLSSLSEVLFACTPGTGNRFKLRGNLNGVSGYVGVGGTFDTEGYDIHTADWWFYQQLGPSTFTMNAGSSVVSVNGWWFPNGVTYNADDDEQRFILNHDFNGGYGFYGGGGSYPTVELLRADVVIGNNNTFYSLKSTCPTAQVITFIAGTTQSIYEPVFEGDEGRRITLQCSSITNRFTLLKLDERMCLAKYCDILHSNALPGGPLWFYDKNSTVHDTINWRGFMTLSASSLLALLKAGMTTGHTEADDYYVISWYLGDPIGLYQIQAPAAAIIPQTPTSRVSAYVGSDTVTETFIIRFYQPAYRTSTDEAEVAAGFTRLLAMREKASALLRADPTFDSQCSYSEITAVNPSVYSAGDNNAFRVTDMTFQVKRTALWGQ